MSLEINPLIYDELIFDESVYDIPWGKNNLTQMMLEQVDSYMKKENLDATSYHTQ